MPPPICHDINETETAPFLGKIIMRAGYRHSTRARIADLYTNRGRVPANGDIKGSAVTRCRVHDRVGRQLRGEQDGLI
jgi:hypothetical protein